MAKFQTIKRESVSSLKGASARQHGEWTFVVFNGCSYGFKGSLEHLKSHKGSFELTITVNSDGQEFGHLHLAETL